MCGEGGKVCDVWRGDKVCVRCVMCVDREEVEGIIKVCVRCVMCVERVVRCVCSVHVWWAGIIQHEKW